MSLLLKYNGQQLKQLAAQKRQEGASEQEMLRLFGKQPYYWDLIVSPPYGGFKPEWRDELGREYMAVAEQHMAVRIPIAQNRERTLEMPLVGQKLLLVEVGGGQTRCIEPVMVNARRATAWFEYKTC